MRFTDRARRPVVQAQEEAKRLEHNYIGPEHLLLGLIRAGDDVAARVLTELGVDLDRAREQATRLLDEYQRQGKQAK
jgi:ATP-dependent Clp protease ATP-binding subunit ClpC